MESRTFFNLPDGTAAHLYSLRNRSGFGADITDWGGAIVRLLTPDRDGKLTDVVLGFAEPSEYVENDPFFGALIGRVANRISGGKFELDGKCYQLECNDTDRPNTLHGGKSYGRRQWRATVIDDATLELALTSPDGDAGFPGKVEVKVTYHVGEDNSLSIDYRAETDKTTVVSMTNHAYFNLSGEGSSSCDGHTIRIAADRHTEVNALLQPTGRNPEVAGTVYDLRQPVRFEEIHRALPNCFDDNFVLADRDGKFKENVATAASERTGITMNVSTTAPGIQFYMGFFLDGSIRGKSGNHYPQFSAFCLEAQAWPDAVNHPEFPSIRLKPGQVYRQKTVYRFGVER